MNLRNVLRAYSLLRQLSDDESALLETLRQTNDTERALLVEAMSDKPQKKSSKKGVGKGEGGKSKLADYVSCLQCGAPENDTIHRDKTVGAYHDFQSSSGKSKHASSLQQQISGTGSSLIQPAAAATIIDGDDNSGRCQAKRSDDRICMLLPDHNIHHLPTTMDYHEFVVGKSDAQSAAGGL